MGDQVEESPNSLRSRSTARVLDLLSEGPIKGLVGDKKGIYINEVAWESSAGDLNFNGLTAELRYGTSSQTEIPGFPAIEREIGSGQQIRYGNLVGEAPLTPEIQINDSLVDAVRVTIQVPALVGTGKKTGDIFGASVQIQIEVKNAATTYSVAVTDTITGKTTSPYERSYRIQLPKNAALTDLGAPFKIRVSRLTPDATDSFVQNATTLAHYTEIIDHKLSYPDTAYIGMTFDSQLFKSGIPNRQYLVDGLKMAIPSNYYPFGITIENNMPLSEDFTGTTWAKNNINTPLIANNVTAPDGTLSAQALVPTATSAQHSINVNSTSGLPGLSAAVDYVSFVHVRQLNAACTGVQFIVYGYDAGVEYGRYWLDFSFATGTATLGSANLTANGGRVAGWGVEPLPDGWYRLWIAGYTSSTRPKPLPRVFLQTSAGLTFAGNGTTAYAAVWGWQVHPGTIPYQYLKNSTTAKVTGTSAERYYYGTWDGTFKTEWTNNPAWVLYLLLTHPRIGMGQWVTPALVDKWSLYNLAKYCDELVPDGYGGYEPRFTFNGVIRNRDEAYNILQNIATVFRGIVYWGAGSTLISWDAPKDASILVTPSNVIDGLFDYKGVGWKARHSAVLVKWNDPNNLYKDAVEVVEDQDLIQRFGWKPLDTTALGCTSRGQAYRWGKWILYTEKYETETVVYKASFDHMIKDGTAVMPGDIIKIADPSYAGVRFGGRLDRAVRNYLLQSNTLDNATSWARTNTTVTASNLIRGGITFDSIFETAVTGTFYIAQTVAASSSGLLPSTTYNYSVITTLPPANAISEIMLRLSYGAADASATGVRFNLSTGATSTVGSGITIANIQAQVLSGLGDNRVWRFSFDFTTPATHPQTTMQARIYAYNSGAQSYAGSTLRSMALAHAQITNGSGTVDTVTSVASSGYGLVLDNPVTLNPGVAYSVSAVLPDGTIQERAIVSLSGTRTTVELASAFGADPKSQAMWIISSLEVEPRLFRVLSVRELEKNIVEVTALYHNPDKFAMVEQGMEFEEPSFSVLKIGSLKPPTGLSTNEYLYLSVGKTPLSAATLSWTPPANESRAMTYEVHWKEPGEDWKFLKTLSDVSVTMENVKQGLYSFRVRTLSSMGTSSTWQLLENVQFFGITKKPAAVTNFNMNAVGDQAYLTWTAVTDPTIARFVVKVQNVVTGALWGSGIVVLDNIPASASHVYVPLRYGTYMIKPVSIADVEADSVALVISDVAGINNFNATETIVTEPTFAGTKTNCSVVSNTLMTTATGGLYPPEAIYELSYVVDLGEVYTNRVTPTINAAGQRATYTMNTWGFLNQVEALDGGVGNSWSAVVEYATTKVAPATATAGDWSEWRPLIIGDSTARGYKFRLRMLSYDTSVQVRVSSFKIVVDMPDRVEGQQGVSVPATTAGLPVTYTNAFKAVPAVAVTIQNAQANDVATLSSETRTGFTVKITNAGSPVSRLINWVAKGYGKQ